MMKNMGTTVYRGFTKDLVHRQRLNNRRKITCPTFFKLYKDKTRSNIGPPRVLVPFYTPYKRLFS